MLSPNDAFLRLKKEDQFLEETDRGNIHWYWHQMGNGFKAMARRDLNSSNCCAPTIYFEFHINDTPITQKRRF